MRNFKVFYLLILLTILSCQKDEENYALSVAGVWFQDAGVIEGSELSYRNVMILKTEGAYERSLQIVETNNVKNVIGYASLVVGEYQIKNKKLKLFKIEQYGLDNENQYLNRDDLVFEASRDKLPEIELESDKSANTLTLFYDCPLNASCLPSEIFYRSTI